MSPVGRLVFKTSEVHKMRLVGSTPTSSATYLQKSVFELLQSENFLRIFKNCLGVHAQLVALDKDFSHDLDCVQ